jgi:ADP-heptose:LPS heptosyltransferase
VFTPAELAFAEPYRGMVMIEPNVKAIGHTNKAWRWDRWRQTLERVLTEVQQTPLICSPTPEAADRMSGGGAVGVVTPTFRHACAVLSVCKAFVGTEGGLMHAAAAVGTPAVVLFGGFISPEVTGYASHTNLFTGSGLGCGARIDCQHCRDAMDRISVDRVVNELSRTLGKFNMTKSP